MRASCTRSSGAAVRSPPSADAAPSSSPSSEPRLLSAADASALAASAPAAVPTPASGAAFRSVLQPRSGACLCPLATGGAPAERPAREPVPAAPVGRSSLAVAPIACDLASDRGSAGGGPPELARPARLSASKADAMAAKLLVDAPLVGSLLGDALWDVAPPGALPPLPPPLCA